MAIQGTQVPMYKNTNCFCIFLFFNFLFYFYEKQNKEKLKNKQTKKYVKQHNATNNYK